MNRKSNVTLMLLIIVLLPMMLMAQSKGSEAASMLSKGKYIPDIGTFLNIGGISPAGYSWDGKDVYFRSGMSGATQVYRITEDAWPYQLTTFEDGIDFFTLSYDGTMAIVGASTGGSEQSQLYLMDTKTGRVLQLTSFEDVQMGSVNWAKDDKSIFYRSNQENGTDFFIYRMDVATGESNKVFGEEGGVTGYNYIADMSDDGSLLMIANYTSNMNNELYLLDLSTLKYQKLNDDDHDVMYGSTSIMPDNKTIILTSNDNEDGIQRLATMTIGDPKITFTDDGWIDPKWEIDGMNFSRDFKYQIAQVNEEGYMRLRIREWATGEEIPSPPLDGILGGGMFDLHGSCIVSFTGPTRAPDVWKWNPKNGELKQLTFSIYAGIDRALFRDPELIRFKSFDDLEIPAFLYLPPDYEKGKPIPFIVHAHGGPESQFKPYFLRNFQYLMLNGYGILAVNPRGSSGYGRDYMNMDNYKLRKNSLKDYRASVDWLFENNYTKPGMVGIRGGSYGGYVVAGMITEYPDLFAAAIDIVGIVNFQTFLENTKPYRRALREAEYGPLSDPEHLKDISPIHKAHLIKTPLLVVHGENDPRVPVGEARQILAAVVANGGIVDSLIFADEGHGSGKRVNTIREYRKQVEFFDRHLKLLDVNKPTD